MLELAGLDFLDHAVKRFAGVYRIEDDPFQLCQPLDCIKYDGFSTSVSGANISIYDINR
jgi:hypothetical protein